MMISRVDEWLCGVEVGRSRKMQNAEIVDGGRRQSTGGDNSAQNVPKITHEIVGNCLGEKAMQR